MKTIAFFNNKGGVGKTTLVYHVAHMCAELGHRVLAVDLDPQANLTAMFLQESVLEQIWPEEGENRSILTCIQPIIQGLGDIIPAPLQEVSPRIRLIPGDLGLARFEDRLSDHWSKCMSGDPAAFRVETAFHRIMRESAIAFDADIVLVDVGPNLGAINRAALLATDHVIMPLAPGLFSLQGLRNLGPTLFEWRKSWGQRVAEAPEALNKDASFSMPSGTMEPAGYIVMQHVERRSRPVKAFQKWVTRIPETYGTHVLRKNTASLLAEQDPNCIGFIKNYQSLMPLAEDARKPVFRLTPADGAIGAHAEAVSRCYLDFGKLTKEILRRTLTGPS
ncbi:MAG: ParA family protein [Candidatus Hydrogenedentes bacterium]|nr:ParA family protein [Candidatus Hydrogenedentota bacterium]